jgi:hypothetical protein
MSEVNCNDCGVAPGEKHWADCDVPRCTECGQQRLQCYMEDAHGGDIGYGEIWTGVWPGAFECQEYNMWAKWVDGSGWVSCNKDDPDAIPDLNTLAVKTKWNKELQKRVLITA